MALNKNGVEVKVFFHEEEGKPIWDRSKIGDAKIVVHPPGEGWKGSIWNTPRIIPVGPVRPQEPPTVKEDPPQDSPKP